jgi:hypothetical protein
VAYYLVPGKLHELADAHESLAQAAFQHLGPFQVLRSGFFAVGEVYVFRDDSAI